MKKLLAGFHDGASGRGGPRTITEEERLRQEEEKVKKAEERALARREKRKQIAKGPTLRMQTWLKGINTDINKVASALQEAKACKDPDQNQMYTRRFKDCQDMLQTNVRCSKKR